MTSKPRKQGKAPKPDCKVWARVGMEDLPEYLNKPIDGAEGHECWLGVAPGDALSFHCDAKPGILNEFVLIVDGVIRACEVRRNTTVVFDKALHRAPGRGTQPGAVFRSLMMVEGLNENEIRIAGAGEELSQVGSIVIEGWYKIQDPLLTTAETLNFPTYENSREWYDVNRFIDHSPGHRPTFQIGFNHSENRCASGSGVRVRASAAGIRDTAEWKLSHKYIFNLRSATELHQLGGQAEVAVRNPKTDLFAEDNEEIESAKDEEDNEETESAKEEEGQAVDMGSAEEVEKGGDAEEAEEATDGSEDVVEEEETPKAKKDSKQKASNMSDQPRVETTARPSDEKPKPKPKTKAAEETNSSLEKVKYKPKTKTVNENNESAEKTKPKPKVKTIDDNKQSIEKIKAKLGTKTVPMEKESNSEPAIVPPKKKALYGMKSAPALNASRPRPPSADNADAPSTILPITPPPSNRKSQSFSEPVGAKEKSMSAVQGLRGASEPSTYYASSILRKVASVTNGSLRAVSEVSDIPSQATSVIINEARNHTEASPILGSPSRFRSFNDVQPEEGDEIHSQEPETESKVTQCQQEIADSFRIPSVDESTKSHQAIASSSLLAVSLGNGESPTQLESFVEKRKVDGSTGDGSVEESARPRKTSIAPANRTIMESLRRQQEENDRLERQLEDIRLYNATLESIRELKKKSQEVQESIDAEKERQAQLEAEIGE